MRANRSSVCPSYAHVKQESMQEPVELESIDINDPALPLSPLPRSGIPLTQGTATVILFKILIPIQVYSTEFRSESQLLSLCVLTSLYLES